MKRIAWLCFLLVLAQSSWSQKAGFVATRGGEIVDPDGKPLILRGINLGNWLVPEGYMFKFDSASSPRLIGEVITQLVGPERAEEFWTQFRDRYITREDIRFIKRLGLNSIRVPFNAKLLATGETGGRLEGPGWEMLDRVVRWSREEGLWVVFDMHAAPGGQTGDNIDDSWGTPFLFESPACQKLTASIWREIARRYADEPTVIGYDILNEPIAHFHDTTFYNPKLEPFYRMVVAAIREVDRNHLVFLAGAQWNTNFRVFAPPFDSKAVYTFHKYWCDTTQAMVQEYVDFRERHQVPVWMGESGENTDAWIAAWRRLQERNRIGWCFWPYKKMDSPRGIVSFAPPKDWNLIAAFADHPRATFADVRNQRPATGTSIRILHELLELVELKNCRVNPGYVESLGLTLPAGVPGAQKDRK